MMRVGGGGSTLPRWGWSTLPTRGGVGVVYSPHDEGGVGVGLLSPG